MLERQQYMYPPYSRLIKISFKHKEFQTTVDAAKRVAEYLSSKYPNTITGPNAPIIQKINNFYLRDILVKIDRNKIELSAMKNDIQQAINALYQFQTFKQIRVVVDVDCY